MVWTAVQTPVIQWIGANWKVMIPPKMRRALYARYPSFKIATKKDFDQNDFEGFYLQQRNNSRESPNAIVGDFNNDGTLDMAIVGKFTPGDQCSIVGIVSKGTDFIVVRVAKVTAAISLSSSQYSDDKSIKGDLVVIDPQSKGQTLFGFTNGHFKVVGQGD